MHKQAKVSFHGMILRRFWADGVPVVYRRLLDPAVCVDSLDLLLQLLLLSTGFNTYEPGVVGQLHDVFRQTRHVLLSLSKTELKRVDKNHLFNTIRTLTMLSRSSKELQQQSHLLQLEVADMLFHSETLDKRISGIVEIKACGRKRSKGK
jgi:hypothetical protein